MTVTVRASLLDIMNKSKVTHEHHLYQFAEKLSGNIAQVFDLEGLFLFVDFKVVESLTKSQLGEFSSVNLTSSVSYGKSIA